LGTQPISTATEPSTNTARTDFIATLRNTYRFNHGARKSIPARLLAYPKPRRIAPRKGRPMRRLALLLTMPLAACAQPFEGRVASRLAEAGLSRPMAECMAERWVDRLNVLQLQKISSLSGDLRRERSQRRLTVPRLIERVREVDDPEIVRVVTSSTVACALGA
jgi:hypothetical protein